MKELSGSLKAVTIVLLLISVIPYACTADMARGPIAGHSAGVIRNDGKLCFLRPDGTVCRSITVEIAETPKEWQKGLMGRSGLDDTGGMLFVYDRPAYQSFWMCNTLIPLDIIFVSENGEIINIARRTEPLSDNPHRSKGPAKYVIEVPSGFSDRYQLTEGTVIRWHRN
jgi:uncharacterized membrane protein (UPF0127 family)